MSTGRPERPRLIADIGGTNARFALVPADGRDPRHERSLRCADYPNFADAATAYLREVGNPQPSEGFCAIANPVIEDWLQMTNHAWAFSIEETRRQLGLERLRFVNDFTAQALAIPHLPDADKRRFGGEPPLPRHAMAVIGPGTGLGVSGLIPAGDRWVPLEGEGGHVVYSPVTPREWALAECLQDQYDGHCSAERVVSGIGLTATYAALCRLDGVAVEQLKPDEITRRAADSSCSGCGRARETLSLFTLGLATTAANLAVTLGAFGGVYLCGGILPRLGALFDSAAFRARFEDKGRFRAYMARIPTYVVHASNPALLGLARNLGVRE
jgi:glucokinase